jgi:hypothetical protein
MAAAGGREAEAVALREQSPLGYNLARQGFAFACVPGG